MTRGIWLIAYRAASALQPRTLLRLLVTIRPGTRAARRSSDREVRAPGIGQRLRELRAERTTVTAVFGRRKAKVSSHRGGGGGGEGGGGAKHHLGRPIWAAPLTKAMAGEFLEHRAAQRGRPGRAAYPPPAYFGNACAAIRVSGGKPICMDESLRRLLVVQPPTAAKGWLNGRARQAMHEAHPIWSPTCMTTGLSSG